MSFDWLGGPPPGVAPEVLFRRLSRVPRPSAPLAWQFWSFEHERLEAVALTSIEVAEAFDAGGNVHAGLMARSLYAGGLLLFRDPDEIADLPDPEVVAAVDAWTSVWMAISPCYGRCNRDVWETELLKGARHASNATAAKLMGEAYDVGVYSKFFRMVDRPERFYGLPAIDLTDGQLMCFRVARKIHEERYAE